MEIQERIPTNKYQTQITQELLDQLPQEVQDQFFDIINNVEFVKRLISPARRYAKDMPKDSTGKIHAYSKSALGLSEDSLGRKKLTEPTRKGGSHFKR